MGKIITICDTDPFEFSLRVNENLKDGYKIISSNCSSGYSNHYESMEAYYQVILLNEEVTASEEEINKAREFLRKFAPPTYT